MQLGLSSPPLLVWQPSARLASSGARARRPSWMSGCSDHLTPTAMERSRRRSLRTTCFPTHAQRSRRALTRASNSIQICGRLPRKRGASRREGSPSAQVRRFAASSLPRSTLRSTINFRTIVVGLSATPATLCLCPYGIRIPTCEHPIRYTHKHMHTIYVKNSVFSALNKNISRTGRDAVPRVLAPRWRFGSVRFVHGRRRLGYGTPREATTPGHPTGGSRVHTLRFWT